MNERRKNYAGRIKYDIHNSANKELSRTNKVLVWISWFIVRVFIILPLVYLLFYPIFFKEISMTWLGLLVYLLIGVFIQVFNSKSSLKAWTRVQTKKKKKICVIGAGPVGVCTVKELVAEGHDVICFERQDGVGGVFRHNKVYSGGVWEDCVFTSSTWVTAFSDFPPNSFKPTHWHNKDYILYLEAYITQFNIQGNFQFSTSVKNVLEKDGKWEVTISEASEKESIFHFDAVAVCSGTNLIPKDIDLEIKQDSTINVTHAADYKSHKDFTDQDVLVVGLGESAVDIAAELVQSASNVSLSMRRGSFVIPRINPITKLPNDFDTNRLRYSSFLFVRSHFMNAKREVCKALGHFDKSAFIRYLFLKNSGQEILTQTATKNDDFIELILQNKIQLQTTIKRLEKDNVIFEDNFSSKYDTIIYAHGYNPSFPFLDNSIRKDIGHPGEFYLNMIPKAYSKNLLFLGFARPAIGSIPTTGEIQARLASKLFSESLRIDELKLGNLAKKELEDKKHMFPGVSFPHVVVHWISYMDKLANILKERPSITDFIKNPFIYLKAICAPMNAAYYRINCKDKTTREIAIKTTKALPISHSIEEFILEFLISLYTFPFYFFSKESSYQRNKIF